MLSEYSYLCNVKPAEAYILKQPEPFKGMLIHLQICIERSLPKADLKYKWRIPCYYVGNSPICYLNVSHQKRFVDVGFWNTALFEKHTDKLISDNRKVVKSLRYVTLNEIDDQLLLCVLKEAYRVRQDKFYTKRGGL